MATLGGVLEASTINSWLNIGLEHDIGAMMASIARRSNPSGSKFQLAHHHRRDFDAAQQHLVIVGHIQEIPPKDGVRPIR